MSQIPDEDLLPISTLNDLLFCERRAGMHLIEQLWQDNPYTLEGTYAHQRTDQPKDVTEHGVRAVHAVMLVSRRLGLVGKADVIEFHGRETGESRTENRERGTGKPGNEEPRMENEEVARRDFGACQTSQTPSSVPNSPFPVPHSSFPVPYPIDYKRGRRRKWDNDDVQLCAQALCLEEMLRVEVPHGAIFHIKSKRRREVEFTNELRQKTEDAAQRLHELVTSGHTPPPVLKPRCDGCSLRELCMPDLPASAEELARYCKRLYYTENEE